MRRLIDYDLATWKTDSIRKSLLLHGARQVGKTYAVRQLGKSYDNFIEINFEANPELKSLFDHNLDPKRILRDVCAKLSIPVPQQGSTLVFFDEVQAAPQAIIALRYFYEIMPEIHVIAAGSLLEFAIQQVGVPVGRVQSMYMYPLSFMEFLVAMGYTQAGKAIIEQDAHEEMSPVIHDMLIRCLAQYAALGGMPAVVESWSKNQDVIQCAAIHHTLLGSYRQDFHKYARYKQVEHVQAVFDGIPLQLGRKFKYSDIDSNYRARELSPALDLLCMADVAHRVSYTAGQGIPLGAQKKFGDSKVILLDVGLSQAALGLQLRDWLLQSATAFVNKGQLIEALIGQELLAYTPASHRAELYYWHRRNLGGEAEIDYLIQDNQFVIPIEVKGGKGSTLKSMHVFLHEHPNSPYGIRLSTQNFSIYQKVKSLPLYAVVHTALHQRRAALEYLVKA